MVAGSTIGVNKFGRSTNVDSGIDTDIWDGANATDDVDIWVAPTDSRTHQIKSSSTSDDGLPGGVGARTVRIYGLTDWDTAEINEDIVLDGTTNVGTLNTYVIIHRMKVLTKGATSANVGKITATADVDGTVTAQINAGEGQTQMAVYGVPSVQHALVHRYYCSQVNAQAGADTVVSLLLNPEPDVERLNFLTKHTIGLRNSGTSFVNMPFAPYADYAGPFILKMQANADSNNMDISAGFDLLLIDVV